MKKIKSRDIYWFLLENNSSSLAKPSAQMKWEKELSLPDDDTFKQIYKVPFTCCRYTKLQTFQFKILHRIIACNYWLYKMKIHDTGICNLCNEVDTIQHHFIDCLGTLHFWNLFFKWWNTLEAPNIQRYYVTDIIFGYPEKDNKIKVLNYVLLIAKYHIYKQKQNKSEPFFPQMLMELKHQFLVEEIISKNENNHSKFLTDFEFVYNAL